MSSNVSEEGHPRDAIWQSGIPSVGDTLEVCGNNSPTRATGTPVPNAAHEHLPMHIIYSDELDGSDAETDWEVDEGEEADGSGEKENVPTAAGPSTNTRTISAAPSAQATQSACLISPTMAPLFPTTNFTSSNVAPATARSSPTQAGFPGTGAPFIQVTMLQPDQAVPVAAMPDVAARTKRAAAVRSEATTRNQYEQCPPVKSRRKQKKGRH